MKAGEKGAKAAKCEKAGEKVQSVRTLVRRCRG